MLIGLLSKNRSAAVVPLYFFRWAMIKLILRSGIFQNFARNSKLFSLQFSGFYFCLDLNSCPLIQAQHVQHVVLVSGGLIFLNFGAF